MIQAMRNMPKMKPWPAEASTSVTGMPTTPAARTVAAMSPASAEIQTRFFNTTRKKNRVTTGSADTAVDRGHQPSGL